MYDSSALWNRFENEGNRKESYKVKLNTSNWNKRRNGILCRDKYKCRKCGSNKGLQVHHVKYLTGKMPWKYPDNLLITLCKTCHDKEHAK
jgi:5-methylcytosine-specific restriction endonuclease McrA